MLLDELYEAHANLFITIDTVKEFVPIKLINYNIRILFNSEWKFKKKHKIYTVYTLLGINSLKKYGVTRRTIKKYKGEFAPMEILPDDYIKVRKEHSFVAEFKTEEDAQLFVDEVIMPTVISEKLILKEN